MGNTAKDILKRIKDEEIEWVDAEICPSPVLVKTIAGR